MAIRDCQSGGLQEVAAGQFILAAGPWTGELLARAVGPAMASREPLAEAAIGLRSERSATQDPIDRARRFLFLVPQEDTTLVGTWYGMIERCGLEATLEPGLEVMP